MAEEENYAQIGNNQLLILDNLSPLSPYDPKKKQNEITATGLSSLRTDGKQANPAELGALLEMNVLMTLLSYKQSEMNTPLTALRGELGGTELLEDEARGVRLRERQELDVTLMDGDEYTPIRFICRCQVKHRSAKAGADEVSALVDKFRSLTVEMILSGKISGYDQIRKADLYFIASAGDPGSEEISVHPGARYKIEVSYPYQEKIRGLNPLPLRSKIRWLDDRRLELRYWGKRKGGRVVGDPEIYLPGSQTSRALFLEMARDVKELTALEKKNDPNYEPPEGLDIGSSIAWAADRVFGAGLYQNMQREWARLTYTRIMRLIYAQDDLILRRYMGDYSGIEKAGFGTLLKRLDSEIKAAEKRDYTGTSQFLIDLEAASPKLYQTFGSSFEGMKEIKRTEADSMISTLELLVKQMYTQFEKEAITFGLMPYADEKLRLRVVEGENFAYGPAGLYVKR